jgi:hypothetical protein
MKIKLILTFLTIFSLSYISYSQDYSNLKDIVLKDKTDYPIVEDKILECSKYILNTPMDDKNLNRLNALQFLMRWMDGTPDFTFNIDETIGKIIKSNQLLLGVHLACMTKFVLENRDKAKDEKEVKYNSIVMLLNYCELPGNNVNLNRELKKMIKAKKEDKLKEYLNL